MEFQLQHQSYEYSGLISFRIDWFDLLAVQGSLKSLLQHHSSKASILWHSAFFMVQLLHPYMTTGKTIALTKWTFVGKIMSLLLIYCLGFLQIEEKRTKEAVRVIPEAKSSHSTVLHGHRDRTMTEFHELGTHSTETRLKTETAVHRSVSGHLCGGVQTPGKRCAEESDRDRTPGSPSNSEIS